MKFVNLFKIGFLLVLWVVLISVATGSNKHWKNAQVSGVQLDLVDEGNQRLLSIVDLSPKVRQWWSTQRDSAALQVDTYLLETILNEHPLVANAQVTWNLKDDLRVKVQVEQAVAHVRIGTERHLLNTAFDLIPAPQKVHLDLPVITGTTDSASAYETALVLQHIQESGAVARVAQLDVAAKHYTLVPQGWNHVVLLSKEHNLGRQLGKLKAFYNAQSTAELKEIKKIDVRYKNQVVHQTR